MWQKSNEYEASDKRQHGIFSKNMFIFCKGILEENNWTLKVT